MKGEGFAELVVSTAEDLGTFTAISTLSEQDDWDAYSEAMRLAYWNRKNLGLAMAIAVAGVSRLLAEATRLDSENAYTARSAAKALLYDAASFSWPGWNEPGIAIDEPQRREGLGAARSNLEEAVALGKNELARSRAHWMLGAHLLTDGRPGEAQAEFASAGSLASDARSGQDVALARSFSALSRLAAGWDGAADALDAAIRDLEEVDDGAMFVVQVTACRDVLGLS